jgi:uncharacterized membrane protein YhhN
MYYEFLIIILVVAAVDWLAVGKGWKKLEYFAKPGTMVALLVWLWLVGATEGPIIWFVLGVLSSLAGDVFLMLPNEKFLAGLVTFLLAHIAYIIGFNTTLPPLNIYSLFLLVLVVFIFWRVYTPIAEGLDSRGERNLRIPVLIYAIVISLMLYSAWLTLIRPNWSIETAISCAVGATLFFLSDTMIAWDRFITPIAHRGLKVMVTYHLGQIGIIVGAATHFFG